MCEDCKKIIEIIEQKLLIVDRDAPDNCLSHNTLVGVLREIEKQLSLPVEAGVKPANGGKKEIIRQIAWIAWKGAANAYQLYPDGKHTFGNYWEGANNQFDEFIKKL